MNVLNLCDPEAAAVPVEATVADAIRKMLDFHVGAVAIIDSERRVAGIFTERDVLRKFSLSGRDPAQTPVRELMTTPVELATSQTGPGRSVGHHGRTPFPPSSHRRQQWQAAGHAFDS